MALLTLGGEAANARDLAYNALAEACHDFAKRDEHIGAAAAHIRQAQAFDELATTLAAALALYDGPPPRDSTTLRGLLCRAHTNAVLQHRSPPRRPRPHSPRRLPPPTKGTP
jgi:hypothetical protein